MTITDEFRLNKLGKLDPDAISPVVRESLIIAGFLGLIGLGLLLPGTHHTIPGRDIAISDLIIGAGTLGIVASLVYAAPKVHQLTTEVLMDHQPIVDNIADITKYGVIFGAVLVGHVGFAPLLRNGVLPAWGYDLIFLMLALFPLGLITYRYYGMIDPITTKVTTAVEDSDPSATSASQRDDTTK